MAEAVRRGGLDRLAGRDGAGAAAPEAWAAAFLRIALAMVFALSVGAHGGAGARAADGAAGVLALCGVFTPTADDGDAAPNGALPCGHCLTCAASIAPAATESWRPAPPPLARASTDLIATASQDAFFPPPRARAPPR